jgi:hypothetical protein
MHAGAMSRLKARKPAARRQVSFVVDEHGSG